MSEEVKKQTLVFPIEEAGSNTMVLLGEKVASGKLGYGLIHGFGGDLEEGESPREAAIRELEQESRLRALSEDLEYCGKLSVYEGSKLVRIAYCYRLYKWQGNPERTDEMAPLWVHRSKLPFENMFEDTKLWLPEILQGGPVSLRLWYSTEMKKLQNSSTLPFNPNETD